jgi:type I restriction enzyme, S subunit
MSNWPWVRVREVSEKVTVGFVGSMSKYFVDDGVPLLRGQNIQPFSLNLTNLKFIPKEIHEKWRKSSLEAGDVVIVRVGYPGTAAVIPTGLGPLNAASLVIIRTDKSKLDPSFLANVLNSPWGKATVQGRLVGAAQQVFNTNTAADLEIPYPPLPTQRRIASILSAYDDLIENNTRRIAILEEMARRLYDEWFVQFRFPGHEGVPMVDSEIGKVPEGWKVQSLPEAIEINPRTIVPKEGEKLFVPMAALSVTNMVIGSLETKSGNSGAKFQNGDTLVARITPCLENGKTGYVNCLPPHQATACGSTEFIVLRSKEFSAEATYLLARSDRFRDLAITSMSGATGRQRVRAEVFDDFLVAVPDPETKERFQRLAEPAFKTVKVMSAKNINLRTQRDLLLPKLISGEIDVSEVGEPVEEAAA